ncbi:MAG: glycine--tRNA ligase [candidate division Zixibacteria bacterium RBG_16_43_9]|nr:MAG: glycine--tRNA ligase [candidate division Zixibacteria bacterium RBG_16_43_9]
MDKLVSLCKRRGFIFQSSEIYGGINSCWDYGPLGVELKNNIKQCWWKSMTQLRDDIEGLDASILMHPQVWVTSGHVASFADPMVDCKNCKMRFRAEEVQGTKCPNCGGELTEARQFNLMFKTHMGPVEDDASMVYLRPETAQGIYVNFLNVLSPSRQKPPFGIAQIGKAFRNEISPGNFIFRSREFEQMEMQFFINPKEDDKWIEYWKEERMKWYHSLGIKKENLRFHQHDKKELAFYAKMAFDIEYNFPFGWKEIEGIHNRTDYDLSRHTQASGKDLSYYDDQTKERFIPYIIETSAGVDRSLLVCLLDAYHEEVVKDEERTVLRLDPKIAPIKAGVYPLVKRDNMPEIAKKIEDILRPHFKVFYDEGGAIGRRYRRQDEVGTPFGITVDSQTLQDQTVTLRERDSMEQVRVKIDDLVSILNKKIWGS